MKTAILFAAAAVVVTSLPLFAQQADATAQQSTAVTTPAGQTSESTSAAASSQLGKASAVTASGSATAQRGANSVTASGATSAGGELGRNSDAVATTASGSATAAEKLRPVDAELQGKLDSKSAHVGDPVTVKTTQAITTADGTVLPKGTRLIGHVTSVQARSKASEDSQMAIQFDRAQLKGGRSLPIHSVIESVNPPASAAAMASMQDEDAFAGGMGSMGGGMRGGAMGGVGGMRMGGALAGGGEAVGGLAHGAGRVSAPVESAAGQGIHSTGRLAGHTFASTRNLAAGASGMAAAHATGVRGVMLAGDATGSASGMLSASRQNIHLDGGTQMVLGLSAAQ